MGKLSVFAKRIKSAKKSRKVWFIILLLAVVLSIGLAFYYINRDNTEQPANEGTITYSTDNPDESKENADNYNWRGAGDEPKKIRISQINVDAFVQKAGVDQNGKIAVPNNVHLAGWFADSAKPGQKGLSIIDGHVSGRKAEGVFKRIGDLSSGDEFEVELGDGSIKKYRVLKVEQVKESDSAAVLFSQSPKVSSQLNLVTCAGSFDRNSNQYEDRIIVSAELIN